MPLIDSYDGFIFDYGKVLVHDQTASDLNEMAETLGLDPTRFEELYWKDRLDYDKGLFTGIEYWQSIGTRAGKVLSFEEVNALVKMDNDSWMHFDELMWTFVNELRAAGKRVAILSNMPMDLGQAIKLTTQRFAIFDQVTLSYEVKSVKPEAAIYEHCLTGLKTALKRTIFLDDKLVNVRGAEMLGLNAVEFLDRDAVLTKLRS